MSVLSGVTRQCRVVAVGAAALGLLLTACGGSGSGDNEGNGACPPLMDMARIVSNAEREFNSGTRTLGQQLDDFERLQPIIERVVNECSEEDTSQGFVLAGKFGAITNALSKY